MDDEDTLPAFLDGATLAIELPLFDGTAHLLLHPLAVEDHHRSLFQGQTFELRSEVIDQTHPEVALVFPPDFSTIEGEQDVLVIFTEPVTNEEFGSSANTAAVVLSENARFLSPSSFRRVATSSRS